MERLTQKYTKYLYIVLIIGVVWQLLDVIFAAFKYNITWIGVILIILATLNIILLTNSLVHNIKQQFTECKVTTNILRITIAFFTLFQVIFYLKHNPSWIVISNYLIIIALIEIALTYRIKSIGYLERLAEKFSKDEEHIIIK